MTIEAITKDTLESLAVFPLPSTVLFPGTALPLHVFEQRYLNMVRTILEKGGALAIVRLRDEEVTTGSVPPDLCDIACAGRIVHVDELPNGRLNILVHGLERVRLLEELPLLDGYRRFRADFVPTIQTDGAGVQLARLQSCLLSLKSAVGDKDKELVHVLNSTADPLQLADILSAVLVHEPDIRQQLLAEDDLSARLKKLIDAVADLMVRIEEPDPGAKLN